MKHIAIITVVYNNYADLHDYFASFEKQTDSKFVIYLIDVSTKVQKLELPKFVKYFKTENKGYAAGLNEGLKLSMSEGIESFVFMNNDTTVARDFVEKAKKSLQKHPCALIGGKIYYSKGYEYHLDTYKKNDLGHVIWYAGGTIDWDNVFVKHRGVDKVDKGDYDKPEETDFVTGCLMVFDTCLVKKAGTMAESYFMYFEDADWVEQAKKARCKIMYDPSIVIWHKNSQSTGGSGSAMHQKYQNRNRLTFGLKYAPSRTKAHLIKNYVLSLLK